MAVSFYFQPAGFSPETYDEAIKELERAGAPFGSVPGRVFHCALEVDGSIAVFDVWESMEQFEEFGKTLIPIMNKLGADPGQPMTATVHNLQHG
jgi:hypothetical protein